MRSEDGYNQEVSLPAQAPLMNVVTLKVPEGAEAGQLVQFKSPDGTMMQVPVPEGKAAGTEFQVRLGHASAPLTVTLTVPDSAEPGKLVQFEAPDGQRMSVAVPEGKKAGDQFQVQVGAPPSQVKLTVPENVKAGDELQFQASNGTRMRVKVPEGLKTGDTFTVGLSQKPQANELGQLCSAVGAGDLEAVKTCLSTGVSVNGVYDMGFTPLFYAATGGHAAVAKHLLENNADCCAKNYENRTPLHWAARNGYGEVVRLLLAAKAPLDLDDRSGRTAYGLAVGKGHTDVAEILKAAGAAS